MRAAFGLGSQKSPPRFPPNFSLKPLWSWAGNSSLLVHTAVVGCMYVALPVCKDTSRSDDSCIEQRPLRSEGRPRARAGRVSAGCSTALWIRCYKHIKKALQIATSACSVLPAGAELRSLASPGGLLVLGSAAAPKPPGFVSPGAAAPNPTPGSREDYAAWSVHEPGVQAGRVTQSMFCTGSGHTGLCLCHAFGCTCAVPGLATGLGVCPACLAIPGAAMQLPGELA